MTTRPLRIQRDDPIHPLNHTRRRREALKRALPREKFEELMKLAYIDDMPSTTQSRDVDENVMHEEGLNKMLTSFASRAS